MGKMKSCRLRAWAACLVALSLAVPAGAADPWVFEASPDALRAHMAYLASDDLAGREAGTPGYDLAAAYVARQFEEIGLQPLGDGGTFLQAVTLIQHRPGQTGAIRIKRPWGGSTDLVPGEDFRAAANPHGGDVAINAPAVFAGYGVVAPNVGRDDFDGLNVRGKIVVVLDGAPHQIAAADRSFVSSARAKAVMARKRGAVGLIVISETWSAPPTGGAPAGWSWTWATPAGGAAYAGVPVLATVQASAGYKLLGGSAKRFEAMLADAKASGAPPRFDLPGRFEVFAAGELGERRASANVVGLIQGSDPKLRSEYIVMSGHLDHIGLGAPVEGDAINNGALDNAGGISTLIEAARGFATGPRPRRSVIFLAVTAEEKGLIGSDYFVRNPPVARRKIVANVNLDMPIMTYDFVDVAAIGAEHSDIVRSVERAAARMDVKVSPDPIARLGVFTRSDHYRFVEQGIPAVFLVGGFMNGGEAAFNAFYDKRYHRPNDDLSQPIDYGVAARWARLSYEIARELADQPVRPLWRANNLFGGRFAEADAIER